MTGSWTRDFIVLLFGGVLIAGIWIVASGDAWGWIVIALAVLAVLVRMFERTRHEIRHISATELCPTCGGSGRVEKEEARQKA